MNDLQKYKDLFLSFTYGYDFCEYKDQHEYHVAVNILFTHYVYYETGELRPIEKALNKSPRTIRYYLQQYDNRIDNDIILKCLNKALEEKLKSR
jgi:hypothetical protein